MLNTANNHNLMSEFTPYQPDQPYNQLDPRARRIAEIITTDTFYPWWIDEEERNGTLPPDMPQ